MLLIPHALRGSGLLLIPAYITSWILSRIKLSETAAAIVVNAWVSLGAGTTSGPTINEAAPPRYEKSEATAVAVALWSGANHVVERKGPALIIVGPAKPFKN